MSAEAEIRMEEGSSRPMPTIVNWFEVSQTGTEMFHGGFRFCVKAGVAILQDKLSEAEARQLADVLNWAVSKFRVSAGITPSPAQQPQLNLFPLPLSCE